MPVPPDEFSSSNADAEAYEMDESTLLEREEENVTGRAPSSLRSPGKPSSHLAGVARHTLGLILLLCVVFLWTLSNFLGSSIFADNSYAKPFFLTYLNTSFFMLCILPRLGAGALRRGRRGTLVEDVKGAFTWKTVRRFLKGDSECSDDTAGTYVAVRSAEDEEEEVFLKPGNRKTGVNDKELQGTQDPGSLGLIETARKSLAFCILWFVANYFAMACLQYTTVASTTILTSTSSIWTLLIGALTGIEKFTWRKLCGVLASLAGIVLISQVDLRAADESKAAGTRRALDDFPDKTPAQLALGDALALLSAVIYGFYTITVKKMSDSALPKSIHMPTFFGFVGLFNIVLLFPLFPILHFTKLEPFAMPPNAHIWMILLTNSISSLLSDICWAYAMVFTSPLVVTVGLSLTIPLSLIGEMIIQGRFESWVYWAGAMIVVGSFVFVERAEKHEEEEVEAATGASEELGEPGPAIIIEDFDEVREEMMRDDDEHEEMTTSSRESWESQHR